MTELYQPITIVALFIVSAVGGLIVWELKRIHARIDRRDDMLTKYIQGQDRKWERHLEDSQELHEEVTEIKVKQDMHLQNGHRHRNET